MIRTMVQHEQFHNIRRKLVQIKQIMQSFKKCRFFGANRFILGHCPVQARVPSISHRSFGGHRVRQLEGLQQTREEVRDFLVHFPVNQNFKQAANGGNVLWLARAYVDWALQVEIPNVVGAVQQFEVGF